jgi:hypothetical protein
MKLRRLTVRLPLFTSITYRLLLGLSLLLSLTASVEAQRLGPDDLKSGWAYSDKDKLLKRLDVIDSSQGFGVGDYEKLLSAFNGGDVSDNLEGGFFNKKFVYWVVIIGADGTPHEKLVGNIQDVNGDDSGYGEGSLSSHEILNQQDLTVVVFIESKHQILNAALTDPDDPSKPDPSTVILTPTPSSTPATFISYSVKTSNGTSPVTFVSLSTQLTPSTTPVTFTSLSVDSLKGTKPITFVTIPDPSTPSSAVTFGSISVQLIHDVLGGALEPLNALFQQLSLVKTNALTSTAAIQPVTMVLQEISSADSSEKDAFPDKHLYVGWGQCSISPGTYNRCSVVLSWPVSLQANKNLPGDAFCTREVSTIFADEVFRDWEASVAIGNTHSGDFFTNVGQDFTPNLNLLLHYYLTGQYQTLWDSSSLNLFGGFGLPSTSSPNFTAFDFGLGFGLGANPFHTGLNLNGLGLFLGSQLSRNGNGIYTPKWFYGLNYFL